MSELGNHKCVEAALVNKTLQESEPTVEEVGRPTGTMAAQWNADRPSELSALITRGSGPAQPAADIHTPDLEKVVAAWPRLPENIRSAIMALVNAVRHEC